MSWSSRIQLQCGYCFPYRDNFLRIIPPAFGPSYLESPSPLKAAPPNALRPTTLASVAPAISIVPTTESLVRLLALTRRGAFGRVSGQKRIVLRASIPSRPWRLYWGVFTLIQALKKKEGLECGFFYQPCWQFWCSSVSPHAAVVRSVRAPAFVCLVRPLVLAVDVIQKGDLVCHAETNPMTRYRDRLPQLDGRTFLTDGGLDPTLML